MTMKGLVFAGLALLCGSLGVSAVRAATLAVQPEVICPDPVMAALISHTLDQELRSEHYTLHATWPAVRLILYAVPTVGNRKNPHGWSIAVAHAAVAPLLEALGPRVCKILCARHSMRTWRSYATYQEEPGGRCRPACHSL